MKNIDFKQIGFGIMVIISLSFSFYSTYKGSQRRADRVSEKKMELTGAYEHRFLGGNKRNIQLYLKGNGIGECHMDLSEFHYETKLNYNIRMGDYTYSEGKYKYVSFSNLI